MSAHKLKITFIKAPCSPCSLPNMREKHMERNRKSQSSTGKLWKSTRESYLCGCFCVQVDGKGPSRLCYSISSDAAGAVDTSRVV